MAKIHSIETFGTVDGPGIRFVIFVQGCPMRCLYCHNPDTWNTNGGKEMSASDLLAEINKYKNYFLASGGVTLSGGEPLLQIDFAIELFAKLKEQNIHTCIDTSGILFDSSREMNNKIDKLLDYTDLVLLDIKHIDNPKHLALTGKENTNVLNFAKYLNKKNIPMWVRFVLVPTITDDIKDIKALRNFLDSLENVKKIEVLPYHTMGIKKYKELNIDYKLEGVDSPSAELISQVKEILSKEEQ